jgi:hypothetical protein
MVQYIVLQKKIIDTALHPVLLGDMGNFQRNKDI